MPTSDYNRIEQAIQFLEANFRQQPALRDVAASAGLSEYHFQRMFRRWAGVSPKRFLQFLTVDYSKGKLREGRSLLDTTYAAGLSSTGRLHDLFVATVAVTPGQYKDRGTGLTITHGFHDTPFGKCLIAITDKGISNLEFVGEEDQAHAVRRLESKWRSALIREDQAATQAMISRVFHSPSVEQSALPLHVHGTNFQIKVWEALLKIPCGDLASYHDVAKAIGHPTADRAVATAVARNPIAFLIPCHRVIRKSGAVGGYRWGTARKKALLAWEAARTG
jgi:AraC family transcriptional regulator of adaptative response/methylated-DNA-[protein]-cysteine methyltransferase